MPNVLKHHTLAHLSLVMSILDERIRNADFTNEELKMGRTETKF